MTTDLDRDLTDAAAALRSVADTRTLHRFEPPPRWSSPGRLVVPVAVAASLATAVIVVGTRDHGDQRAADLPPGVSEGRYGTELPLVEADDGDGDPATVLLEVAATGRTVRIGEGGAASAVTWDTTTGGSASSVPPTDAGRCVEMDVAGGSCGADETWDPVAGPRTPDGGFLVRGVPDGTAVVTFEAGSYRWWQRPYEGVAAFPYSDEMPVEVHVTALDPEGRVLADDRVGNDQLTPAEVAARPRVSTPTGDQLASVYGVDETDEPVHFGRYVRREGVSGLLGYEGPFALQVLAGRPSTAATLDADGAGLVGIFTVPTADVDGLVARLAPLDGAVAHRLDQADGTTVVVWAGRSVPAPRVDAIVGRLASSPPTDAALSVLDGPASFAGISQPVTAWGNPFMAALLTDVVGTVPLDGRTVSVRAQRDDLGAVQFAAYVDGEFQGFVETARPDAPATLQPYYGSGRLLLAVLPPDAELADLTALIDGPVLDAAVLDATGIAGVRVALVEVG